jgi:hypothetical protein
VETKAVAGCCVRGPVFAALVLTTVLLSACTEGNVCAGVAFGPPINVRVRDQDGTPQALGAEVWFASRSGVYPLTTESDTLTISGGEYGVAFDIEVSKRYYATSVAAPWLTDSARITIAGHPASSTDPPCS